MIEISVQLRSLQARIESIEDELGSLVEKINDLVAALEEETQASLNRPSVIYAHPIGPQLRLDDWHID